MTAEPRLGFIPVVLSVEEWAATCGNTVRVQIKTERQLAAKGLGFRSPDGAIWFANSVFMDDPSEMPGDDYRRMCKQCHRRSNPL